MFLKIKRIFKFGWLSFRRQSGLSVATIFILVLTIVAITSLYFLQYISQYLIIFLQEKVDISVYFKPEASEEEILKVKEKLSSLPEVKSVEYISKEEALKNFVELNKENPRIMESLEIIGTNPLLAALNIKAQQASQYQAISNFLESSFEGIIDHTNYPQKRRVIERLFSMTSTINKIGVTLSLILAIITFLVAFNTIKIAIYNSGKEISIMRLVGASNWFIRGPFVIQGMICGAFATLISFVLFGLICYFAGPKLSILAPGLDIFNYFQANVLKILFLQLGFGVGTGVFSSVIAIRKYLNV
ncbi:ABC transporter permease [bacterium]|nr:ABC transporter permease [bacterium]